MSEISDERLIAYIDGELDAQGCAEVDAALNSDPQLGDRLAAHLELKQAAAGAFGGGRNSAAVGLGCKWSPPWRRVWSSGFSRGGWSRLRPR
jgi:anti-sigma factor RsiW